MTRSIKRLQSLCPWEMGCMMLCRTTPLLRPQHHRGWTLWCHPWLHIVTTTNQHQSLWLQANKVHSLVGLSLCMANTRPSHHFCLLSLSRDRNDVGEDGEEDFSDADDGLPDPFSTFKDMMDPVYLTFPEACGQAPQDTTPLILACSVGKFWPPLLL